MKSFTSLSRRCAIECSSTFTLDYYCKWILRCSSYIFGPKLISCLQKIFWRKTSYLKQIEWIIISCKWTFRGGRVTSWLLMVDHWLDVRLSQWCKFVEQTTFTYFIWLKWNFTHVINMKCWWVNTLHTVHNVSAHLPMHLQCYATLNFMTYIYCQQNQAL